MATPFSILFFNYYFFLYLTALGLSCSTWNLVPEQRPKAGPLHWESGVFATGPARKSHSSILAWRIPWTEEPGGLQSMRSQSRTGMSD